MNDIKVINKTISNPATMTLGGTADKAFTPQLGSSDGGDSERHINQRQPFSVASFQKQEQRKSAMVRTPNSPLPNQMFTHLDDSILNNSIEETNQT